MVDAKDLVPGDVIEVGRGQSVPADARLSDDSRPADVSEAALTGESLPVSKHAEAALDAGTPLAERVTMVYKGTTIIAGRARAVVAATGGPDGAGPDRHARGRVSLKPGRPSSDGSTSSDGVSSGWCWR